jgi:hypothetical protein
MTLLHEMNNMKCMRAPANDNGKPKKSYEQFSNSQHNIKLELKCRTKLTRKLGLTLGMHLLVQQ